MTAFVVYRYTNPVAAATAVPLFNNGRTGG